jgi:hypothetical protein
VLNVICEQASKPELTGQLVDVFEKEGFFRLALEHLSQDEITINARLYLIGNRVLFCELGVYYDKELSVI